MLSTANIKSFYISFTVVLLFVFILTGNAQSTFSFPYSGSAQTMTVPANVCCIFVKAWGGGGAGGGNDAYAGGVGGGGAYTESVIIVSPGDILTIYVGGAGMPGAGGAGTAGGNGGWGYGAGGKGGNAGPDCCSGSGGGAGGSSGVLLNGAPVIFAAGGAGAGGGGCKSAGGNGGAGGINGSATTCTSGGNTAASGAPSGAAGQSHPADGGGGGGGGGGINGGQGGFAPPVGSSCNPSTDCGAGGGGGGGSWSSGTNTIITNGSGQTPGNNGDPDYPAGSSTGGGNTAQGTSGFLKLDYYNPSNIGFTNTSACYGTPTQFTDNTISVVGTTTSWSWDFGDGSPVNTNQSPSYTYASGGSYNATLTVTNSLGCSNTLTKVVQVFYKPTANFTHSYACAGWPMYFSNTSFVNNATSITDYAWDFGDGTTSILQDPVHSFSIPGPYNVNLITTTADGCTDAITIPVIIYDAPGSAFTFSNTCLLDSAHFTNTTTNPTLGTIASWFWDFGDGTPPNTTVWSPGHLYPFAGNYTVILVTYSSNGCADTLKDTITVFMPHAYFGFNDVCLNEVMNFSDLSSVTGGGSITGWIWSFGDGSPLNTTQNPSYTYTNAGTYIVTLIATSDIGCNDTISKNVVVHALPNAEFLKTNVCDGSYAQFNDISTILSPDLIQGWSWTFGDGATVNNQTTSHLYAALGSYQVELLTVSNFGCKDSISKTLFVNPNPVVIFSANDTMGCEPLCISFQDLSTVFTGSNAQWVWNLGDGSALNNSQSFDHCYTNDSVFAPNFFDVTLTVTSDSGCVSTFSKNNYITVYPMPESNFVVQPETASIINPVISFIDLSIGANVWNWNFGDTATSSSFNPPPHTYADTGTYLITLNVLNQYGCADVDYHSIIIDPDFVFYIPNAFTPDGDGINDNFTGKGVFIKEFEMLIFDRWGNMIFKTTDIDIPWDGKANNGNEMAQRDVYVYAVTVTDLKMIKHRYKGIVTLVR